ncbi:MAG TPA: glycosyl transferase [Syntrophus sp. (in: bacteria)]|nr:MAG: glycosyl transferase [Syntrophus sp. GWC2_56_31]HBB15635.1 glycosyl transferase [Syntrophus sp. (in: bacteria)]
MTMLSIVVPVYKEERNIPEFVTQVASVMERVTDDYEIIFTLDPSPDGSEEAVLRARESNPRVKMLKFSRRFGQPMATLAGLQYSSGEAVIVMDVDLQDPPELIPELTAKWSEGYDVVCAQRKSRAGETSIKKLVAWIAYRAIRGLSEVDIPPNTGDFRLMSRRVVNELNKLKESHGFLRGMVALVGFKQTCIRFDRPARFSGAGQYNRFIGSIRIGINGLVCFSGKLLFLASVTGFFISVAAVCLAVAFAFMEITGAGRPVEHPVMVVLILLLAGIHLLSIGLLGEYVSRIYDEVKGRPKFIVDRAEGFDREPIGNPDR